MGGISVTQLIIIISALIATLINAHERTMPSSWSATLTLQYAPTLVAHSSSLALSPSAPSTTIHLIMA